MTNMSLILADMSGLTQTFAGTWYLNFLNALKLPLSSLTFLADKTVFDRK